MKAYELISECSKLAEGFTVEKRLAAGYGPGMFIHWHGRVDGKNYGCSVTIGREEIIFAAVDVVALREHQLLEDALKSLRAVHEQMLSPEERRLRALERQVAEQAARIGELEAKVD